MSTDPRLDRVLARLREAAAGLEDEPDCDIPDGPMVMLDDAERIITESWPQPAPGEREEVTCPEPIAVLPLGSAESAATARPETTGAHTSPKPTGASSSSPGEPSAGRPSEKATPTDAPSSPTTQSGRAGGTGDGERDTAERERLAAWLENDAPDGGMDVARTYDAIARLLRERVAELEQLYNYGIAKEEAQFKDLDAAHYREDALNAELTRLRAERVAVVKALAGDTQIANLPPYVESICAELARLRTANEGLLEAATLARRALDNLMGDTDLDDDESEEMRAAQALASVIPDEDAAEEERARVKGELLQWFLGWVSTSPPPPMVHVSWTALFDKITEVCRPAPITGIPVTDPAPAARPIAWLGKVDQGMGHWHFEVAEPDAFNAFPVFAHPVTTDAPDYKSLARELRDALEAAARSLETIEAQAGRDPFLADTMQVRGYANSRAGVARTLLATPAVQALGDER